MTNFQKGKSKQQKINGQWIFGDFSEGLYLLDTPRSITEQLGSLALVGGSNTFCEKGALIPQYGYVEKAKIDNEFIITISKDVESGYLFLLSNLGNVFVYTPDGGLKRYKTKMNDITEDALMTCKQNELITSDSGMNLLFGGYYPESSSIAISKNVPISTYGYYSEVKVPEKDGEYYWLGKKVDIAGIGEGTISRITYGGYIQERIDYTFDKLAGKDYTISGIIDANKEGSNTVKIGNYGSVLSTTTESQGGTVTETKRTYSHYAYTYKRNGGADDWALSWVSPVGGYIYIPVGEKLGSTNLYTSNDNGATLRSPMRFNTVGANGVKQQGDAKAKIYTMSGDNVTSIYGVEKWANKGAQLFGTLSRASERDKFTEEVVETHIEGASSNTTIVATITTNKGTKTFLATEVLPKGTYTWRLRYTASTDTAVFEIISGNSIISSVTSTNFGVMKDITDNPTGIIGGENGGLKVEVDLGDVEIAVTPAITLRINHGNTSNNVITENTTISEKSMIEIDFQYTPEEPNEDDEIRTLNPRLIQWCCNRLFIEDSDGFIYYSQVGRPDGFEEKYGAGYFGGFYGDNSELLSIEEFLGKVLLTKKNGMYTLTIGNSNSSYSTIASTGVEAAGINIEKIAEIGQENATDHVIVNEAIYAYDTNSASIVQAAAQNVFGSIVAGKTLISADYLNAQNFGIVDRKRCLTYNSEAQVFILYYGEDLTDGIILTAQGSLFHRKLDRYVRFFIGFNQGVLGIMSDGTIFQDFRRNTVIPDIEPVAEFEAIGLKDNRLLCGSILEVTELNGVEYDIFVTNTDTSYQHIQPYTNYGVDGLNIPPLIYSDSRNVYPSFELQTKWAAKKSNLTRIYAPMSGREGISIGIKFPANVSFCLAALRIPDFSQGE